MERSRDAAARDPARTAPSDRVDPRFARPRTLFFGVGAQKSATTWIDHYLRGHPEVCLPVRKEQHYWTTVRLPGGDRLSRVASERRRSGRRGWIKRLLRTPRRRRLDRAWELTETMLRDRSERHSAYADVLFQVYRGQPVVGEITPAYALLAAEDFAEMAALGPDVRFLFVMRDPLDRLRSGVKQSVRKRLDRDAVTNERVAARMDAALSDAQDPAFLRSRYDLTIQRLESVVPRAQICYLFYETMFTQSEMDRLADFLGIARRPARLDRKIYAGAGASVRLPDGLLERARQALRPVYEFVEAHFGPQAPEAWRRFAQGDAAPQAGATRP